MCSGCWRAAAVWRVGINSGAAYYPVSRSLHSVCLALVLLHRGRVNGGWAMYVPVLSYRYSKYQAGISITLCTRERWIHKALGKMDR